MADWRRPFDDPILLSLGRQLVTLRDAAEYITKLTKAEHDAPEWQAAMEALLRSEYFAFRLRADIVGRLLLHETRFSHAADAISILVSEN